MSRPSAIINLADMKPQGVNFGLYGEPGVGKSVLAASGKKTLILANRATELDSAKSFGLKPDVWVVEDLDELSVAEEYVRHEGVNTYEWVWVDNVTLLQDQAMDARMLDVVAQHAHRNLYVPDKPDYQAVQNRLGMIFRRLVAAPINFGWIAHVEKFIVFDKVTGEEQELLMPMLQGGQGKFTQKLCGYMSIIGYMHPAELKGEDVRALRFKRKELMYAKSRYKSLGAAMVNPTMPKIMEKINADLSGPGAASTSPGNARPARRPAAATK